MGRHHRRPARRWPDWRRGGAVVVAALMVAAILINVVQFRRIDTHTIDWFRAVHRYPTGDIVDIWYSSECNSCRERYGLHYALRVTAPGSRVLVDRAGPYGETRYLSEEFEVRLFSFGGVAEVEWVDGGRVAALLPQPDDTAPAGLDPTPYIVASGPGGGNGAPWALAISPDVDVDRDRDPDDFVAEALRNGSHRERERTPREFIVLRWEVPRGERYDYQDLVLDTALLPGGLAARAFGFSLRTELG